ncbi:hypothetical protein QFZ42_003479 [Variovorax paradoxus]|uniref:hypothetical protein n=1 Tax=Variovorax paradoxus TaxID=34073 RepID=UPI00278CA7C5|nr:hypothetical protein [Variovorax paradoxus]MDQ0571645.1 hypothetical protein [Variovorax paradoxus]
MSNEGKTWGWFAADGSPIPGTGSERFSCPVGRWVSTVREHPMTGEMFKFDDEPEHVFVSECRMRTAGVKLETCDCGKRFVYP